METIEGIFNNSTFKGYDKAVPEPRPGTVSTILGLGLELAQMYCHVSQVFGLCGFEKNMDVL